MPEPLRDPSNSSRPEPPARWRPGRATWLAAAACVVGLAAAAAWLALDSEVWRAEAILAHRDALRDLAASRPTLALAIFVAVYFLIISTALPIGPPMSLIAGMLFGRWVGTAAVLLGATAGALVVRAVFRLSADTRLADTIRTRAGPRLERASADLRANAFGYLIVMRLVPFFPFFVVNALSGLAGIPASTFALATLIGRCPAAFLYVGLGQELGEVRSFAEIAAPRIVLTLCGLAALALLPVVLTHRRARRGPPDDQGPDDQGRDCIPADLRPASGPATDGRAGRRAAQESQPTTPEDQ